MAPGPHGLAHHVLLLAPVARAHERDGELHGLELRGELLHGELRGALDEPGHLDGPRGPVRLGHGPVVAHVVQRDRRDEAVRHEARDRRLRVERVFAGVPDQRRVAPHPRVRGGLVARILHGRVHFQARAVQRPPVRGYAVLVVGVGAGTAPAARAVEHVEAVLRRRIARPRLGAAEQRLSLSWALSSARAAADDDMVVI
jgi:hypothetical protein